MTHWGFDTFSMCETCSNSPASIRRRQGANSAPELPEKTSQGGSVGHFFRPSNGFSSDQPMDISGIPSGKRLHNGLDRSSDPPSLLGESTISIAMFNFANCQSLPEGIFRQSMTKPEWLKKNTSQIVTISKQIWTTDLGHEKSSPIGFRMGWKKEPSIPMAKTP